MMEDLLKRVPGLSRLLGKEGSLQAALVKATGGSFMLKISQVGLVFLLNALLARLLGSAGLGAYSVANSWATILGTVTTLGFSRLLVREVPVYRDRSEWSLLRGLLRRANQLVLPFSSGVAVAAVAVALLFFSGRSSTEALYTFCIAMALVPITAFIQLRQTTMRGLRRIVSAQVPETVLRPVLTIAFVGLAYLLLGDSLRAPWAMTASLAAATVAFLVGAELLRRSVPDNVRSATPEYQTRLWMRGTVPLMLLSVMQVINMRTDVIMVGSISGTQAAGLYTVAVRGAELVVFVLMAAGLALGPTISRLYAAGEMQRLQRLVTRASRLVFLISLPIALALILFGQWFLLIFGEEFTQSSTALSILCIGTLFNSIMCAVGLLLMMAGYERRAAVGVGIGAGLNVALNALLVPRLGIEGAALATATSTVVWNSLLAYWVYKKLGIYPAFIGPRAGRDAV